MIDDHDRCELVLYIHRLLTYLTHRTQQNINNISVNSKVMF